MPQPAAFRFFPSTPRCHSFTATTIFATAFPVNAFLSLLPIRTLPCIRSISRDPSVASFADLVLPSPQVLLRPTRYHRGDSCDCCPIITNIADYLTSRKATRQLIVGLGNHEFSNP